ncbi:tRNA (adenosine(37)-N6)-threonylcarbamoyltransferase complex dimerization subunit type 1 TsaB [Spongiimicrobium sp. 3-5]|uniref:tRNA (adenosine(37)-N6)-threonylcarbamoyltransferase complex dimerization subunit type 1 TsaB n=1 Tax=Spongiimicrobium sp. 3-5 TaxID=3332596 RepID=UPI003980DAA6
MAIILNLETATTNCSVSIAKDGKLIALKEHNSEGYSHSELLHVFIKEVLEDASLKFEDLDAIAVSKGPGSYTGLRIGVSAAKGLCFSLNIPLISVATLRALAHQAIKQKVDFIIPVLDARRMEVYAAVFNSKIIELRKTKAEIIDETSFQEYVKKGKVCLIGSGAEKCTGILEHPNFVFNTLAFPSAKEMCLLSYEHYKSNTFEDLAYFEPYYLKNFMLQGKKS